MDENIYPGHRIQVRSCSTALLSDKRDTKTKSVGTRERWISLS